MSRASREKGKRGERAARDALREGLGLGDEVQRMGHSQSRGGTECADVESPLPVWVEVGVGKTVSPMAKLMQATNATDGRTPIAMTRRDRGNWVVSMWASDFFELVRDKLNA